MDILASYSGLSLAFAIISALFLYFIIGSNMKVVVKAVIIPIVIWFTLVLYFTPQKLMGWPTPAEPPDGSVIILPIIKEPSGGSKGFIDMLVIVRNESKQSLIDQLDAKNVFSYRADNTPRLYRLPYDRNMHKDLLEAQKAIKKRGGFMTYSRHKGKPGSSKGKGGKGKGGKGKDGDSKNGTGIGFEDTSKIKVINPATILKKDKS